MNHAIHAYALGLNDDRIVISGNFQILIDSCESDAIQKRSSRVSCPPFISSKKPQLVGLDSKRH